jgi:hypothetical protein
MHNIGLPIIALLRRMGFRRDIIGSSDQRAIGARIAKALKAADPEVTS